jgi:hypothetical protein
MFLTWTELPQVIPRVDSESVAVFPNQLERVVAHRFEMLQFVRTRREHRQKERVLGEGALYPGPAGSALGAGARRAKRSQSIAA